MNTLSTTEQVYFFVIIALQRFKGVWKFPMNHKFL